jgi:aryl-alcohol dehydrogenase-like predicted oxidoreductase
MAARGIARGRVILATKVGSEMGDGQKGLSREQILTQVEGSLRRLRTDVIDLYQTHVGDPNTPMEEILSALDSLVQSGKVRHIGCCNLWAEEAADALTIAEENGFSRFTSLQNHYNLTDRRLDGEEIECVCRKHGIRAIPFSPLGGGFLTGKYRRGEAAVHGRRAGTLPDPSSEAWTILDALCEAAWTVGATPSQVAIAWVLRNPLVASVIVGPRSVAQLDDNLGALGLELSGETVAALERVERGAFL